MLLPSAIVILISTKFKQFIQIDGWDHRIACIDHGDLIPGSMTDRRVDHGRIDSCRSLGQSERGIYHKTDNQ